MIKAGHVDSSSCYTVLRCARRWDPPVMWDCKAQFSASGSSDDAEASARVWVRPSFLLCRLLKELKHSSYGFYVRSLFLSPPLATLSSLRGVGGEVFQESSINVRAKEPRVRVSFHQPVNYLLSVVEAVHGGSLDVPFDLLSGVIVNVDLE